MKRLNLTRVRRNETNRGTSATVPLEEGLLVPKKRNGRPDWEAMSDDELIVYARKIMKESGINARKELERANERVYRSLWRRKLLERVGFEEKRRSWEAMSDKKLVTHVRKFMKERGISGKTELRRADKRVYAALHRRKKNSPGIMAKIGFKEKRRPAREWEAMSDEELVAYAKRVLKEMEITGRKELHGADRELYYALHRREKRSPGIIAKVGFKEKRRPERDWKTMSDDELVTYARKILEEKGITGRAELEEADIGTYCALLEREKKRPGIIAKVGFKEKKRPTGFFSNMSDGELLAHAKRFMEERGIEQRKKLQEASRGLYRVLIDRKLLDCVFSLIEEKVRNSGLDAVCEALEEFGEDG